MHKRTHFFIYAIGIFTCYFYFGILQEKITKGKYILEESDKNENGKEVSEKFVYFLALCSVQCAANFLFSKFILYFWPQTEDKTKTTHYASSALTYLLGMLCSNMALQWVPYPTQVVGKAAKPIPVMVLGVLIGHRSYPFKKYTFVLLIVTGVVMFMFKNKPANSNDSDVGFGFGELLLLLSLTMDGLTGAVQERMRAETPPTAQQMMQGMNFWSCLYLGVALIVTGESITFFAFVSRHPAVILHIVCLAVAGALGQLFILFMVSEFGPLPCSVVTTTRKFFTVLGSVIFFGNPLIFRQWAGAALVFTGLFLDSFYGKSPPKKK